MIDCENEIFTKVHRALIPKFPKLTITSEPTFSPASFPCVAIYEADNGNYDKTQDSSGQEKYARVMYEVYAFSNKKQGRKTECKSIFDTADVALTKMGFTRITKQPIPTDDVYRIIGRYTAVISNDKNIYRR